jgi:hypothetical protein
MRLNTRRLTAVATAIMLVTCLTGPTVTGASVHLLSPVLTPRVYLPSVVRGLSQVVPVTLEPAVAAGEVGQEQWYDVRVNDVSELRSLDITVRFDPHQLEVIDEDPATINVQIAPGDWSFHGDWAAWPVAFNEYGEIFIPMYTSGPSFYGSATVARFRVRPLVPGPAWLRVEKAVLEVGAKYDQVDGQLHAARLEVAAARLAADVAGHGQRVCLNAGRAHVE